MTHPPLQVCLWPYAFFIYNKSVNMLLSCLAGKGHDCNSDSVEIF